MDQQRIRLTDLGDPRIRTLHIAWGAFFVSFLVWFSHAPLLVLIKESFGLSSAEVKALMILNVALTIPARIVVGGLVDRYGPRRTFSSLLVVAAFVAFAFASATTYAQLALFRFMLGFVGAGFVIGIRLVGEWFPAKQLGLAEGIYGGWGNFGSAGAAVALPAIAGLVGGADGWRYAVAATGVVALVYAGLFYRSARDTPKGSTYFKPKRTGALEVTTRGDYYLLMIMVLPMQGALAILVWKLSPAGLALLSQPLSYAAYAAVALVCAYQLRKVHQVNSAPLAAGVPEFEHYRFKQVIVLSVAYFLSFGSELAVISMLPLFFLDTFDGLTPVTAGLFASSFAFTNLVARPGGGFLSDRFGRKRSLTVMIGGMVLGYLVMAQVSSGWPIAAAVAVTMCCSCMGQAASGAVFAMVPLVKRRMTGQVAGMTGAYGNVGGVCLLTVLSLVDYSAFFLVIAATSAVVLVVIQFMDEPSGHIAELREDGTVQLISVS